MLDVKTEVENLLAEMRAKALTIEDVRATVEISALARQMALPEVTPYMPVDLISCYARTVINRAWVQHQIRQQDAANL